MKSFAWLTTVVLCLPCNLLAGAGASGWTIFTKAQTVKYAGIASVAPGYADISAVLFNPALPATMMSRELSLMSEQGFADDICGGFIYGVPVRRGVVTGGITYYDLGDAELNWVENGRLVSETVKAQSDMMGFISYAGRVSGSVCMGMSLKGASSEIAQRESAMAFACDAGAAVSLNEHRSLSIAVRNIGSSTPFISKKSPLPSSMVFACNVSGQLTGWYYVAAAGGNYLINDDLLVPEAGLEVGTGAVLFDVACRLNSEEFPASAGFGLVVGSIFFQYICSPGMNVGTMHRLGITYRFTS